MSHFFHEFQQVTDNSYIFAQKHQPLLGSIEIGGAKNMVTKIFSALLMAEKGSYRVYNVPMIGEVLITLKLIEKLGVKYKIYSDKSVELFPQDLNNGNVVFDEFMGNRISILMAGPILKRLGKAIIHKPGGCNLGQRKVDFHTAGLRAFGVKITEHEQHFEMEVGKEGLVGTQFRLPFPSVGATENLIITGSCAKGMTEIHNCAIEPEIMELIKILQAAGIQIQLMGDRTIRIQGGQDVSFQHIVNIPDRIESVSFACAALATKGDVFIKGARHDHLMTFIGILQEMGAGIEIEHDGIRFFYKEPLKGVNVKTDVVPGLATDFQQPLSILLSQASQGESLVHETIFENRFGYLEELNPIVTTQKFTISDMCPPGIPCRFQGMGHKHAAYIPSQVQYGKGEVEICDLRAGYAFLIAGILSEGLKIKNLPLLYRGYENPVGKLQGLGANVQIVK